jgi:fructan beta-fructosidase
MSMDDGPITPVLVMDEPLRPQYHFTPRTGWLNDPNGLVYYDGEYHLFFQYYPHDTIWGPMHWGHAVSKDLVNWQHLPIALYPDELGYIFSGSAVIDWHNVAGFGKEAMVLFFTHHHPVTLKQSQSLAYSLDKGRTWTKYTGNPIIPAPENLLDFRDPKVIWYEDDKGVRHWVMVLAARHEVLFYTSDNLIDWEENGRFGSSYSPLTGMWETPDLFPLEVPGSGEKRWVLTIGFDDKANTKQSGTLYFVGEFDGKTFTSESPEDSVLWADFGADFYAAQSWSDMRDGRRLWLAWMNSWMYAFNIPTTTWRGALSLPREVGLVETEVGIRLVQQPVSELKKLRDARWRWQNVTVPPDQPFHPIAKGNTLEIIAEFEGVEDAACFGIRVLMNGEHATTIGCEPQKQRLFIDRRHANRDAFHEAFPAIHKAKLPIAHKLRLHIFVDRSMVEVFVDDGQVCFSERVFPAEDWVALEIFSEGARVTLANLDIFELKTAVFTATP